jgi:hypothetical protein
VYQLKQHNTFYNLHSLVKNLRFSDLQRYFSTWEKRVLKFVLPEGELSSSDREEVENSAKEIFDQEEDNKAEEKDDDIYQDSEE